jgi:hypothetical protein
VGVVGARTSLDGDEVWDETVGFWIALDNQAHAFAAQQFWDFAAEAAQLGVTAIVRATSAR